MAGLVIGALFILPFLLFSATSGQLADKYDKTRLIRFVKNLEIAIMLMAAWGFIAHVPVLLLCTFLMGCTPRCSGRSSSPTCRRC
jgi:MFS family permease